MGQVCPSQTPRPSVSRLSSNIGFTCRSAQPLMHAETLWSCLPALRSAQRCCFFGDYVVPWQDEVAQTPTGYESLWYDTFIGSHAAASEERQYNLSYTSSKYKTLNRSYSPLTANKNTEDDQQKYPLPYWCRRTGRRF